MPTVLITGGAGFIGSNFIHLLRAQRPDWAIINYDALTYAGNLSNLESIADSPQYQFIHGDIRDRAVLRDALDGCEFVVHFAAESHVDRSIHDSGPFVSTNVVGTQVLLDACRDVGSVKRFVHVSTDEVYGSLSLDDPSIKFTEDSPIQPSSPYAASKAASDHLVLAYAHTFKFPAMVTRCSNNFGPYQFPEKVIPLFVTNLMQGKKVPLYGDGRNVRDWLHVVDHCEALLAVLERGQEGRVYNIGGDNERSNLELTRTILELTGFGEEMIQRVPDRLGHDLRYAIDATRISDELGWQPRQSQWPAALKQVISWYEQHEIWWKPLQERVFGATLSGSKRR